MIPFKFAKQNNIKLQADGLCLFLTLFIPRFLAVLCISQLSSCNRWRFESVSTCFSSSNCFVFLGVLSTF